MPRADDLTEWPSNYVCSYHFAPTATSPERCSSLGVRASLDELHAACCKLVCSLMLLRASNKRFNEKYYRLRLTTRAKNGLTKEKIPTSYTAMIGEGVTRHGRSYAYVVNSKDLRQYTAKSTTNMKRSERFSYASLSAIGYLLVEET